MDRFTKKKGGRTEDSEVEKERRKNGQTREKTKASFFLSLLFALGLLFLLGLLVPSLRLLSLSDTSTHLTDCLIM